MLKNFSCSKKTIKKEITCFSYLHEALEIRVFDDEMVIPTLHWALSKVILILLLLLL